MEKKVPVIKLRGDGGFSVAVFADNKKRDDGTEYVSYSAVLQKSWKGNDGQWQQQSVSMFDNNLAGVALLLSKVAGVILDMRNTTASTATNVATETKTNAQVLDELSDVPF